jgi:hypothetical protein
MCMHVAAVRLLTTTTTTTLLLRMLVQIQMPVLSHRDDRLDNTDIGNSISQALKRL